MKITKVSIFLMIVILLSLMIFCAGSNEDETFIPTEYSLTSTFTSSTVINNNTNSNISSNSSTTQAMTNTTFSSNALSTSSPSTTHATINSSTTTNISNTTHSTTTSTTNNTTTTSNILTGTSLKIATYNTEALSSTESSSKYNAVEAVLAQINADIFILEELGSSSVLTRLKNDLSASYGLTYGYSKCASNGYLMYNGILSKYPITSSSELSGNITDPCIGSSYTFTRGVVECLVQVTSNFSVYVLGGHLKALSDSTSFGRRRAEAKAIENRISTLSATYSNIIVAGDMNTVTTSGPGGSCANNGDTGTTITYLMLTDDGTSSNDFKDAEKVQFPTSTPITYDNGSVSSRIDYIFVSPNAWNYYVSNSCQVVTTGAAAHSGGLPSDHYPVTITLYVP